MRPNKLKRERDAWQKLAQASLFALSNLGDAAKLLAAKKYIEDALSELENMDCKVPKLGENHDCSKID